MSLGKVAWLSSCLLGAIATSVSLSSGRSILSSPSVKAMQSSWLVLDWIWTSAIHLPIHKIKLSSALRVNHFCTKPCHLPPRTRDSAGLDQVNRWMGGEPRTPITSARWARVEYLLPSGSFRKEVAAFKYIPYLTSTLASTSGCFNMGNRTYRDINIPHIH